MSLQEQERALFDLLFDRELRARFGTEPNAVLSGYELDRAERADLAGVSHAALNTDAKMRVYMLLAQLCRELPLSFALASGLAGAGDAFRDLVDRELLDVPVALRAAEYGRRLMDWAGIELQGHGELQAQIIALMGAETAMARSGGALRQLGDTTTAPDSGDLDLPEDWIRLPGSIAAHTCAVIVPLPFDHALERLCPACPDDLWRTLDQQPVALAQVGQVLQAEEPRLLLARHFLQHAERCVPLLSRRRIEVSPGFAPLLRYLDGRNRIADILRQLEHSGATGDVLPAIRAGFEELCRAGIIVLHPENA